MPIMKPFKLNNPVVCQKFMVDRIGASRIAALITQLRNDFPGKQPPEIAVLEDSRGDGHGAGLAIMASRQVRRSLPLARSPARSISSEAAKRIIK